MKHIKLKPKITHDVKSYIEKNFSSDFIIGVHYKGTDKMGSKKK